MYCTLNLHTGPVWDAVMKRKIPRTRIPNHPTRSPGILTSLRRNKCSCHSTEALSDRRIFQAHGRGNIRAQLLARHSLCKRTKGNANSAQKQYYIDSSQLGWACPLWSTWGVCFTSIFKRMLVIVPVGMLQTMGTLWTVSYTLPTGPDTPH